MRKLLVVLICLFCGSTFSLNAQIARLQQRDAEWKSYTLPQTHFSRQVTPEKTLLFRVPADWKQEGTELLFTGPHSAQIRVTPQTVPHGYPLTEYVASILKSLGDLNIPSDSILTRRTQFQDLEAREVHFESEDQEGQPYRSTTWITISGPLAVNVNVLVHPDHAAEIEPLFKATVQSVMFVPGSFPDFETLRSAAIKKPAGGPINEVENVVATLTQLNGDREAAINSLTPLFVSQPDTAIDLLLDRRVTVRSAAAEALARSKNATLKSFLWHVLDDEDPLVAEAAAQRLASEPDVISQLLTKPASKYATTMIARLWPFISKENRVKYLQGVFSQTASDPKIPMAALILLATMPSEEFKFPLARILSANHDPLTIVGLQAAINRGDLLPIDALFKLTASPNQRIKLLAIENLGQMAGVPDIPKLEALISRTAATTSSTDKAAVERTAEQKLIDDEISLSIKKILLRQDLTLAKGPEQWREIIRKAASDPLLDDFAWRFDCEMRVAGCLPSTQQRKLPPNFKVKAFAENLFPQKVTHFTAIPNPAQAVQKLYETLHGLQLDSPRAQANLILIMGGLRQGLGQQLGAPSDAPALIDYTGIKPDSPIVLGAWTAAGAANSVSSAARRAIVLRVKDRERFERTVENYQQGLGVFTHLTDYVAMGTRAAAALPAFLPFSAQAVVAAGPDKPTTVPTLTYSYVAQTEWNGTPIKTIEHRWVDSQWTVHANVTWLAFVGDTAILTEDMPTMRDLLSNAATAEQQLLAANEEFRRAIATDGDVVYFSDLKAILADPGDKSLEETKEVNESGALKFSGSSWENSHRLVFDESEWSKPLLPFHPKELSAPGALLPSSTLAYFLAKLDVPAAWETWPKTLQMRENRFEIDPSLFSLDLKREVLPELGPECGAVLLELPNLYEKDFEGATWAAFCKLKSNKLSDAFAAGKLFRGVGPTAETAEIKGGETSYFVGVKNGFLVVSNASKGVAALAGRTNLAAGRDYSRAAEKVPAGIVAFGGYNLEAAIAAASASAGDGLRAQMAGMALSLASAFHSQSFFATASAGAIEARSSVAMDREGRYAVADFSFLPRGANITYVTIEPHGVPILNQKRLSNLVLRVRAKAPGPIEGIRDDIKSPTQKVEQKSPHELIVTVAARRIESEKKIELPVTNPELAAFLKATGEIASDDKNVMDQARQIAGDDRDAWSVARKLADWTHKNLQWKSVARAGAAETLATREADCSEFSQLYVSMARSLGLPARIVSGLAHSGNSFGGHAWVEVWVGEWVELDPTWGTDFVDATHIRNQSGSLLTAAALNLIDLEVLETRRTVGEFQKSPKALAEHLMKALALLDKSEIEATLDPVILTDEFMGQGAWNGLNEHERDLMSSAYRRVIKEMLYSEDVLPHNVHLLRLEEKGDRAEALCYASEEDMLLKLRFVRRDDVWYLIDEVLVENGLHIAAEVLDPVIKTIEATRAGKQVKSSTVSEFMKALTIDDPEKAVAAADRLLQTSPKSQNFRFFKAVSLLNVDKDDEAVKLLTELSNEQPAYAPALYRLAALIYEAKPDEAIELYKRYSTLEPTDPRGYRDLAIVHETVKQTELAEAAFRKAIAVDPFEIPGYEDLATFLIRNGRVGEVGPVLVAADKYVTEDDDVLASVLDDLEDEIKLEDAERLAASEPERMKTSVWANISLSEIYIREKRYPMAVELIQRAIRIDPEMSYPHLALSMAYLKQSRLNDALKAIDRALGLNGESALGHYQRAAVLARLGRKNDAMSSLQKAIELNSALLFDLNEEADFRSLRNLPAFQKLLREAEKQAQETSPQ